MTLSQGILSAAACGWLFIGCGFSSPNPADDFQPKPSAIGKAKYKVSVRTAGGDIQNFESELVHRIYYRAAEFSALQADWPASLHKNLKGTPEYDTLGKPMGVRIVATFGRTSKDLLGFKIGDLITAAGTTHVSSLDQLDVFLKQLSDKKLASITLVRNGQPHKILYYLEKN